MVLYLDSLWHSTHLTLSLTYLGAAAAAGAAGGTTLLCVFPDLSIPLGHLIRVAVINEHFFVCLDLPYCADAFDVPGGNKKQEERE